MSASLIPRGAVAAGHKATAEAAVEILRAGGNAFDAIVAGLWAACVCEPVLAAPGGGGFLMAHDGDTAGGMPGRRSRRARRIITRARTPPSQGRTSKARFERCGELATTCGSRIRSERTMADRTRSVAVAVRASIGGEPSARRRVPSRR